MSTNEISVIRQLPAQVRSQIATTEYPSNYQKARVAIRACATVDEVAEWSNRSAAMACYARQLQDRAMLDAANRIHARALERIGELLSEIPGTKSARAEYAKKHGVSQTKVA